MITIAKIIAIPPTAPPIAILLFNCTCTIFNLLNVDLKNPYNERVSCEPMQYFQAVKIGKERATKAQMTLFKLAGFAMLTLTTKKKEGKFLPVGEHELVAVIKTQDGFVTILVDEEGYTKAQSKPLLQSEAMEIFQKARDGGITEYVGNHVEIWTESYPTVHREK